MSIDEVEVLQDAVDGFVMLPDDPEDAARVMQQLWEMHKHGRIHEPELDGSAVLVELTDLGRKEYASLIVERCPHCEREL